jgi:hypothetical protein
LQPAFLDLQNASGSLPIGIVAFCQYVMNVRDYTPDYSVCTGL